MDHEEMRAAYMRALNVDKTDFTDVCNICKAQYLDGSGQTTDLVTYTKVYKMWYCSNCIHEELEVTC